MENIRIAVLDPYDRVITYLDNEAPKALHYYDDELHTYLQGGVYTYNFSCSARHADSPCIVEGNKIAFRRKGKDYYLNIMRVVRDEFTVQAETFGTIFELLNEQKEAYKASRAMAFAEYISAIDYEKTVELRINEVTDKKITHEWTGSDTILARFYSIASVFSAEIELVVELNSDYSLKKVIMNAYRKETESDMGIGEDRTDLVLRYGKEVSGITKTADITELYTAIRPFGRDGLTITNIEKKEYDANGALEFQSLKGDRNIHAVQARDRFPSNLMGNENDRYIAKIFEYDTDNVEMLYGQALAELKKLCVPEVEYKVDGYFNVGIGDTVMIVDEEFTPELYLRARVTEQQESFTDPTRNKTTFSNFRELKSEIDPMLLQKMQELAERNKVYSCSIVTDNGIVFKNNTGETTLTASIMDGVKDVTDSLTISWTKDGEPIGSGKFVKVTAADIIEKSVYRYEAVDSTGKLRGSYEVTVMDVKDGTPGTDGKTQYLHTKFSNDGGKTFTANSGETPGKFMGYYVDFEISDSNNPDDYTWVKVEGDPGEPGKDGNDGKDGVDATVYSMQVSAYAIVRAVDGSYTPANITISGKSQTGAVDLKDYACRFKIEETDDMETWTTKYTSEVNEPSKTYVPSEGVRALCCSMYLAGGTSTLLDRQIIPVVSDGEAGSDGNPGKDAYTIVLSNESHTFAGNEESALSGNTVCEVIAYKGATLVPVTIGTISGIPEGMTTSIQNNGKTNAQFMVNVTTAMKTKAGELTISITVDGNIFTKTFSYALALKGDAGKPGEPGEPTGVLELPTEPPVKYDGMLWKCTGNLAGFVNGAVYRWNGSKWELFTFSAKNIKVEELSAIIANLGTVTAGIIKNEDGTFVIDVVNKYITSSDFVQHFYPNTLSGYPKMLVNEGNLEFGLYSDPDHTGRAIYRVYMNGSGVYGGKLGEEIELFSELDRLKKTLHALSERIR